MSVRERELLEKTWRCDLCRKKLVIVTTRFLQPYQPEEWGYGDRDHSDLCDECKPAWDAFVASRQKERGADEDRTA